MRAAPLRALRNRRRRRRHSGRNAVLRALGGIEEVPRKASLALGEGDIVVVEAPGGGGLGAAEQAAPAAGGPART